MGTRTELHKLLCELLGSKNVYFQPPASVKMSYPAIVYSRSGINTRHADGRVYNDKIEYNLILIDRDPDSRFVKPLSDFPLCRYVNNYAADGLNHDVFTIYY